MPMYRSIRFDGRASFWRRWLAALSVALVAVASAGAWGAKGHRVAARIAEAHLSSEAAAAVESILGTESLVEASTWPDWVRSDPAWEHAGPWHYINMPDGVSYEDSEKNPAGDAYVALSDAIATLRDPDATREAKAVALRWVAHLVADLHQPLHVGRQEDRGGNEVKAVWFGKGTNAHRIWDTQLIESTGYSFSEYAESIDRRVQARIESGPKPEILSWIAESARYREQAYAAPEPSDRGTYRYIYENLDLAELRLKQAGLRLALTLEYALGEAGSGRVAVAHAP